MKFLLSLVLSVCCVMLYSQDPTATSAAERLEGEKSKKALMAGSPFDKLEWKSIGPTVFSGRVTDLAVNPSDPTEFYVAYASGGLWYTNTNGQSFEPIFDTEAVMTIGDIAVDWASGKIYVGTGENNSSRSSYSGVGMFSSEDRGETWKYLGLPESHHISRILIDPNDAKTVYAAVLGHLYSDNPERGLYKSSNGGDNWELIHSISANTGAVDLVIHPSNSKHLIVAYWQRERRAWNFVESGKESGIYESKDGGASWSTITSSESLFPQGDGVGRIGIDLVQKNGEDFLYAVLDNYDRRPKSDPISAMLSKEKFKTMTVAEFKSLPKEKLEAFLRNNRFPEKYSAETVLSLINSGEIEPADLSKYLDNANSLLFDTPVIGAEVYAYNFNTKKWNKTHDGYLDHLYNSYGYYFGQVRISQLNPDKIYIMGVPLLMSEDAGASWNRIDKENVHADHHALWVNPMKDGHIINGNDGGVNLSYNDGEVWTKCNSPSVGQFYSVHIDNADPYRVYGGLQDNGVWVGPNDNEENLRWHQTGHNAFKSIMGGDGMQIQTDRRHPNIVYTGFQFGNYFRIDQETEETKYISPMHELGESPYRWNWETPIHLSIHNNDILYIGSNHMHRSLDRGDNWDRISKDLTQGGRKGDVPYGTLTTIQESPLKFGKIYVGSDDGLVHHSKDGGVSWDNVSNGLTSDMWVSKVEPSHHKLSRVFCTLNGYRWDNFGAMIYRSEDSGKNWERIGTDLPAEPINSVSEDPSNENILYVATDHGVYISLDRGNHFSSLIANLPHVAVHDMAIHSESNEIILATHGRSFYKMNLDAIHSYCQLADNSIDLVFETEYPFSSRWGKRRNAYSDVSFPELKTNIVTKGAGQAILEVKHKPVDKSVTVYRKEVEVSKGVNSFVYNMQIDPELATLKKASKKQAEHFNFIASENGKSYLKKGDYEVCISKDDIIICKPLIIK